MPVTKLSIKTDSCSLARIEIKDANFPSPFSSGLEYSAPARGPWTIMHLGLLVPETHIIFVCAQCCLRGVVMSAAELRALDRFSTITIEDCNLLQGDTEEVLIDAVCDILGKLAYRPKAVLIYTSCVHEFIGSDLTFSFARLRELYPDIDFTDCYMTPVLRKRIAPDARNRRQIYSLLRKCHARDDGVTIFGDVRPMLAYSDIAGIIHSSGRPLRTITSTRTYDEYQALSRSSTALIVNPVAKAALQWAVENLDMEPLALSCGWSISENTHMLKALASRFGVSWSPERGLEAIETSLATARSALGNTPIAIDYTATTRPLSLARFLIENGFNVVHLFIDAFLPADIEDLHWLQKHAPTLSVSPTVDPRMAFTRMESKHILAIGQKAAFFCQTPYFVNIIEGDGMDGLTGTAHLLDLMADAIEHPKNARDIIQVKALGCTHGGCL